MNTTHGSASGRRWVRLLRFAASWSALPIGLVAITFAIHGQSMAEKAATLLVMPITVAWWCSLILAIKFCLQGNRRIACAIFALSGLIYCASSPILARCLIRSLESKVQSIRPSRSEPFDSIVVLGGGTSEAPDGRAQLAHAGDRVGLAMQLYHQGLVQQIVVSGDGLKGFANASKFDPSTQAKRYLIEAGVPESAIEELSGENTSQEMRALKMRTELWQTRRCGLLTSAFHMPRALGLASRNGIEIVPIASDYRALDRPLIFLDLLPSSSAAHQSELALREYLGMMLGR